MIPTTANLNRLYSPYSSAVNQLPWLQSIASLFARLYLANVFFSAGLTKLRDWDTTLFLFEEEYAVPLLPYELAAWLGTAAELVLPVLLVVGLATRFTAIGLFVFNVVAVVSLAEIAPAALYLHVIWGLLLAQLALYGGGKISADHRIRKWLGN